MLRRTQTVYLQVDPFFSPRGKVLHAFDELLAGLSEAQIPCVWITGATRAQLDEPRRRLGQAAPYIGEHGCGVYLPEDYFHLKSRDTVRLGRYTCIPIAKPQPAAAEALEELSSDLGVPVVPLRSLTLRELSQNTGLSGTEAERVRQRDFDELFFFAGASDHDIERFRQEASHRRLTLQAAGGFWSLSIGADLAKCVRELGGLYDRALRSHALRVAIVSTATADLAEAASADPSLLELATACDRTLVLSERLPHSARVTQRDEAENHFAAEGGARQTAKIEERTSARRGFRPSGVFHLQAPGIWDDLLAALLDRQ